MPNRIDGPQPNAAPARPLPQNVETEAALLGALMIDNNLIDVVADKVQAAHFFEPLHGRIFEAILRERALGKVANPVILRPYFDDDPAIKDVGGPAYLAQLTGSGAAVIGAHDFADQIAELARRRALIGQLQSVIDSSFDPGNDHDDLLADAESALVGLSDDPREGTVELSAAQAMVQAVEPDQSAPGVLSGIEPLDRVLGPIKPKESVIIAGRPGMGKTILGLNYARGVAQGQPEATPPRPAKAVLYFSLEMSAEQLGERLCADLSFDGISGENYAAIEAKKLSVDQRRRLLRLANELEALPLQIIDASTMRPGQISSRIRRWKRRFAAKGIELGLVVIDYLQLVDPDQRERDPYARVSAVSRAVKGCAKANNVGVLALAQLSRAVEQRQDKRPNLSDLRDSGQIEQDADGVCFLYRHAYYLEQMPEATDPDHQGRAEWDALMEKVGNRIEYIVAKRRGRKTGSAKGGFYGAFQAVR